MGRAARGRPTGLGPIPRRRLGAPARRRGAPGDCEIDAEVEVGGAVASRQGLNIPGPVGALPAMQEEDLQLLRHGEQVGVDMVALSFVQSPTDIEHVREHTRLPLIAKMEKPQAVERATEILKAADCVMVARGDLGIELPIARVPIVQKQLLELAGVDGAPVDHRHPDARLDGRLLAPDARRGGRRRQRDPRRHRRGHALPGDRDRRLPGRGRRDDGGRGRSRPSRSLRTSAGTSRGSTARPPTPPTRSPTTCATPRASCASTRS